MRRILTFDCLGSLLAASLDEAPGMTGLLIVSGGNEIRIGAHRSMAKLAAEVAASGHPVFRFDRRGIGDSEGENGGFQTSGPDIAAAIAAFRVECPALSRIVAFGNCDAASALALHHVPGVAALVLANPWVIERPDDLPAPAAIRAHYLSRLRDPRAWAALVRGTIDLKKLKTGLARITEKQAPSSLSRSVADGIAAFDGPITILLASRDGTAIAFVDEWATPTFEKARAKSGIIFETVESTAHSFAGEADYQVLKRTILSALAQ